MRTFIATIAVTSWLADAALLGALPAAATPSQAGGAGPPSLVLLVYRAPLSMQRMREAIRVADDILVAAGVRTSWDDCAQVPDSCASHPPGAIIVRFTSGASWKHDACGSSVRGSPLGVGGLVSVDVDCASELVVSLQYAADPITLQAPRLMGAVLAHEVGHLLGLRHVPKGLMAGCLGVREYRALVTGRLRFDAAQCRQIQAEAAAPQAQRLAAVRLRRP